MGISVISTRLSAILNGFLFPILYRNCCGVGVEYTTALRQRAVPKLTDKVEIMDFNAWNVDLKAASAYHSTGFRLVVEGSPIHPQGVVPSHFPEGVTAVEQVRLIRSGLKAIMAAAREPHNLQSKSLQSKGSQLKDPQLKDPQVNASQAKTQARAV